MVADKFNMVDMGGIDIVLSQGVEVTGLYQRLVDSIALCRYSVLYNWKFGDIAIPPTPVELEIDANGNVVINEVISVTNEDIVHIYSLEQPVVPIIESLTISQNGDYNAPSGVDGFNPVYVDVPNPPLQQKSVTGNGMVTPDSGYYGLSSVLVNVPGASILNFNLGRLKIDTGEIVENSDYCYSDLVPITSGAGRWFIDLARSDLSSYYIGISLFGEDGITNVGYIRQYESYRSYASTYSTAKFFRIANKVANMDFANVSYVSESLFITNSVSNIFKTNLT